jgi:hypothetical protein
MEVIVLIDSEKIIRYYRKGTAQETFFAYPHIPGFELGNFKREETWFCIHSSDPDLTCNY